MMKRLLFQTCAALLLTIACVGQASATVTLSQANFPDDNFRAALSAITGVNEGSTFNEATLTQLDVSDKGITDLTGLGLLTGLTYLDISGNDGLVTGANITALTALTTLKASNCNLVSLEGTTGTNTLSHVTGPGLVINANNVNITYLDISHNDNFYLSSNFRHLTRLETLIMHHCANYDFWGTPGNYMSSLKYVDVSYCPRMDRIYLPVAGNLEVLKTMGLPLITSFYDYASVSSSQQYHIVLKHGLATLKWLDVSGCTRLNNIYLPYCSSLQHLNAASTAVVGFSSTAGIGGNHEPTPNYIQLNDAMTTLTYLNLANCEHLTDFRALYTHYNVESLDTLILTNDSHLGWSNLGIESQTATRYLDVTNCGISTTGSYVPSFDHLTHLETLLYGENPDVGWLRLNGNSNLHTLDVHGNTGLTTIALINCGLPRTNLSIDDTGCTALTGLKLNDNGYGSVADAMADAAAWGLDASHIKFLYLQRNSGFHGGPLTLSESDCGSLTGIDLGDNGFTSFSAPSLPQSLTALMLGNSPNMTRLEMHNNPGITTMSADTVMRDGSGLYLLGNTALTYMDISGTEAQPNHFQHIGNNGSLYGLPVDTLKASYNKFYTFRNLSPVSGNNSEYWNATNGYDATANNKTYSAYWPASPAMPDSASLEHLTALQYLDLSHCQLKDSVYLHKNTELLYLDVSHNRTIARYTTSHDKGAGYRASGGSTTHTNRNYPDYKKYLWLAAPDADDIEPYTGDYNDTTGLYILDLLDNNKLEYLDISYTGIEQTALTHCHVSNARYIWIQDLPKLKYFYANYNGMRSLGVSTAHSRKNLSQGLVSLERMSVIGMRGGDNVTMKGSLNLHGDVNTKLHYVNFAYSDFDSIGCGAIYVDARTHQTRNTIAHDLDTLIIPGNPIHYLDVQANDKITYIDATKCAFKMRGYDPETGNTYPPDANVYKNGARVGGTYYDYNTNSFDSNVEPEDYGNLTTEFSGLRAVRAHHRPMLTTVKLDQCNALREVYCHDDPLLVKIDGFENPHYNVPQVDNAYGYPTQDADSLLLVWVHNDDSLIELNLSQSDSLRYLHAYNDHALGDALGSDGMILDNNIRLISAWVSNSRLQRFENGATKYLDTLKIWTNPQLAVLDVTRNTGLQYFDLRNCRVRYLDMQHCDSLTYFDCSNDSIQGYYTGDNSWYGYELPRSVPVPDYMDAEKDGKNCIADLMFSSKLLRTVKADNNDLFSLKGLAGNAMLDTLSYCHNHINGIDLTGCTNIQTYRNAHNGRGVITAELAQWLSKDEVTNETNTCSVYYLQLEDNAGDALAEGYSTFLGNKFGHDSLEVEGSPAYFRYLAADGFDAARVDTFTVNASGPYLGTRVPAGNAPRRASVVYGPDDEDQIDLSKIYGNVAVLRYYNNERNYIEYTYFDGRPSPTRDGNGATSTFYLVWKAPDKPTEVEEPLADELGEATVVSERYFDISGIEHDQPVDGVNIIIRQMSDGTTQTVKVMR